MKKFFYLFFTVALLSACQNNKGYTVNGTIEGVAEGEIVYLMERAGMEFSKQDSAVVKNGSFTFTGNQETPVNRYVLYEAEKPMFIDFFLENGQIKVFLGTEHDVVGGTPLNDAYQSFRDKMKANSEKQRALYQVVGDPTTSAEDRDAKSEELTRVEEEMTTILNDGIISNASSPLGVYILNMFSYYMDFPDVEKALAALSDENQQNPDMIALKETIERAKKSEEGQPFIDLELRNPAGEPVKLSDYVGKGELVLVDFWASWCGPCRREMPGLVDLYAKYKDKGLEIVGVSLDKAEASWIQGIEKLGITWPQMSDLRYWESEAVGAYTIRSIPLVVLIDKEGTIVSRGLHGEELYAKVKELLSE